MNKTQMPSPHCTQYEAFNRRRLHYSLLFWSSLALEFSGVAILLILDVRSDILILGALSCFLMGFIAYRLHVQEEFYGQALRNIDEHWKAEGIKGI